MVQAFQALKGRFEPHEFCRAGWLKRLQRFADIVSVVGAPSFYMVGGMGDALVKRLALNAGITFQVEP
jgi:hypothetical protein